MFGFLLIIISSSFLYANSGLVTPNLNSIHLGERGSVLAGGIVARADDASSSCYNPAGLAHIARDSFSASTSSYVANDISMTGTKTQNELNSIASYIANTGRLGKYHWSFSVPTPIYSTNNLQQNFIIDLPSSDVYDLNYTQRINSSFTVIAPGLSIAKNISSTFRIGWSFRALLVNLKTSSRETSFAQGEVGQPYQQVLNQDLNLNSKNLRAEFGLQKDISESISLGFLAKTKTYNIISSGNWSLESSDRRIDNTSVFRNASENDLSFDFELPIELHAGVAYILDNWDIEFDVKYSGFIKNQKITKDTITYVEYERDGTGVPQVPATKENTFIPKYNYTDTFNYILSSSFRARKDLLLSFGLYTDFTPTITKDSDLDLFTPIDLYGATLGVSKFSKYNSTTLGLFYSGGSTQIDKIDPFGGKYNEKISYQNYGISISGSVYY